MAQVGGRAWRGAARVRPQTKRPGQDGRARRGPTRPRAPDAAFLTENAICFFVITGNPSAAFLPANFCVVVPGIDRECSGSELQEDHV